MTKTEQFQAKVAAIPDAELAEKCDRELSDLCKTHGDSFHMCIPPMVDDTDILFSELIRRFESRDKWISVKDRLPKIGRYVLVFTISGASFKGQRLHDGWSAFFKDRNGECSGIHKVTHWMPLPEPPKEDKK